MPLNSSPVKLETKTMLEYPHCDFCGKDKVTRFLEPENPETKVADTQGKRSLNGFPADSSALRVLPLRKNVLLIGFGFSLRHISGDKNFWLELSRELSTEMDQMVIVSINSSPLKSEHEGNIYLYNVQRPFHRKKDQEKRLRFQFQRHFLPWEVFERSATLLKLIPFLRRIVKLHNIQAIHLMDNFGFLTGLSKMIFHKLRIYASAFSYNTHGLPSPLNSIYRKINFGKLDNLVVSSKAHREKLIENGFPREKVRIIRWGIPLPNEKKRLLEKVRRNPSKRVILWTGFTQQIKIKSFYLSLSLAQSMIKEKPRVDFIFAFKPECFHKKYELFQEKRLRVISTNHQDFIRLLEEIDLLLSPVENNGSTLAPPLTWIECMARGIPIISTQVPGVDEILKHNFSGFVAQSNKELEGLIEKIIEDENLLSKVSAQAREWIKENYNIKDISQDYLKLWREDGRAILSS